MRLAEQRRDFSRAIGGLLSYAIHKGYNLVLDEGRVFEKRKARDGGSFIDGTHIQGSKHYSGLAQDFVLYDANWLPITKAHPIWSDLGAFWKTLSPSATWGGDWKKKDLGHFSFFED